MLIAAALDAKPDYPEAHYNRGNVLAALGRYDDALASYDAAIALQPGAAEAHHNRGNVGNLATRRGRAGIPDRPAEWLIDGNDAAQKIRRLKGRALLRASRHTIGDDNVCRDCRTVTAFQCGFPSSTRPI